MNVNYSYVRSKKKRDLEERYARIKRTEELSVEVYDEATIFPTKQFSTDSLLFGRGGVVDGKGDYIEDSSIPGRVHGRYEFDNVLKKDEEVVYCGYLVGHWGHFLIETVSRLWYILENKLEVDKYVFIVNSNSSTELKGNYKEFLELLGITDKIEIINIPVQYKKVYIPERAYKYQQSYSVHYKKIFDTAIRKAMENHKESPCYEKVFLSRSRFKKAQIAEAGLDMLDNYFERNGYRIVHPETISLTELIYLLQNARECAAESGTTPHNILFGKDGQDLTIVERQTIVNPVQTDIDLIRNLNVTYIDGHYTVYPVSQGYGPYILAYNNQFRKFTNDKKYVEPDQHYVGTSYIRKCVKQYMREYKKEYYYSWGLEDWAIRYADSIYEAYNESMVVLGEYLHGRTIFNASQIFAWQNYFQCFTNI